MGRWYLGERYELTNLSQGLRNSGRRTQKDSGTFITPPGFYCSSASSQGNEQQKH